MMASPRRNRLHKSLYIRYLHLPKIKNNKGSLVCRLSQFSLFSIFQKPEQTTDLDLDDKGYLSHLTQFLHYNSLPHAVTDACTGKV